MIPRSYLHKKLMFEYTQEWQYMIARRHLLKPTLQSQRFYLARWYGAKQSSTETPKLDLFHSLRKR